MTVTLENLFLYCLPTMEPILAGKESKTEAERGGNFICPQGIVAQTFRCGWERPRQGDQGRAVFCLDGGKNSKENKEG